jgi:hypothetical protein
MRYSYAVFTLCYYSFSEFSGLTVGLMVRLKSGTMFLFGLGLPDVYVFFVSHRVHMVLQCGLFSSYEIVVLRN